MNYRRFIKSGTFIDQYMQYMSGLETALGYDFWSAVWLLSCAVGRDCVVDRPNIPVHMNVYAMFVSDSGVTRKSTAISRASKVLHYFLSRVSDGYLVTETRAIPEQFERDLHDLSARYGAANSIICVSELVTLLGRTSYNAAWPGILTDLYDCPSSRRSSGSATRGPTNIVNVYCTMLTASTLAWLLRAINPDIVEGGFTSRVIFVVENSRKRAVGWADNPTHDDIYNDSSTGSSVESLGQRLIQIHSAAKESAVHRRITATPSAINRFRGWYRRRSLHNDPFRASYEAREDDHILRLAGLLAINEGSWMIDVSNLNAAIKIIAHVKESGAALFEGVATSDRLVIAIDRIRTRLIESGNEPVTTTELSNAVKNYIKGGQFKIVMQTMKELGLVNEYEDASPKKRGPKRRLWRGTKYLLGQKITESIIRQMNR